MKLRSKRLLIEAVVLPTTGKLTIGDKDMPFVAGDYLVIKGTGVAIATAKELAEEFVMPVPVTARKVRKSRQAIRSAIRSETEPHLYPLAQDNETH